MRTVTETDGFTLVEIMVGLSISTLIAAFCLSSFLFVWGAMSDWSKRTQIDLHEHKVSTQIKWDVWLAKGIQHEGNGIQLMQSHRLITYEVRDSVMVRNNAPIPSTSYTIQTDDGSVSIKRQGQTSYRMYPRTSANWTPIK
jgi:prepilin-type N-terminal cleavage/methylation domain-containing protein